MILPGGKDAITDLVETLKYEFGYQNGLANDEELDGAVGFAYVILDRDGPEVAREWLRRQIGLLTSNSKTRSE